MNDPNGHASLSPLFVLSGLIDPVGGVKEMCEYIWPFGPMLHPCLFCIKVWKYFAGAGKVLGNFPLGSVKFLGSWTDLEEHLLIYRN